MTHPEQDRLLQQILSGEECSDCRRACLDDGLRFLQRRNRQRRAVRLAVLTFTPALIGVALWLASISSSSRPEAVASASASLETARVKLISDEELFSLFPGRPLALIGKPGRQELVFLDTSGSTSAQGN
jgi:hypothetical protein